MTLPPKTPEQIVASPWRFCVAPMMDWTDRHCRYFHRLATRRARLYTEMVNANALVHGDSRRHLRCDPAESPLALQLGGADPRLLARAARVGADHGYDEINLNCGCPSDRVQEGRFGACMMLDPQRVADCVAEMRAASPVPVTVKCRIGVDDSEGYDFLHRFVSAVHAAGVETFIVHARKAWLKGLSPKQNREVPPLSYETVFRLKRDFPGQTIVINGGIATLAEGAELLRQVDGVMLGRAAYEDPWLLAAVDADLFGMTGAPADRETWLRRLRPYIENQLREGSPLSSITRHVLGLYRGQFGGRAFRRVLSEQGQPAGAGWEVVETALRATRVHPSEREAA